MMMLADVEDNSVKSLTANAAAMSVFTLVEKTAMLITELKAMIRFIINH